MSFMCILSISQQRCRTQSGPCTCWMRHMRPGFSCTHRLASSCSSKLTKALLRPCASVRTLGIQETFRLRHAVENVSVSASTCKHRLPSYACSRQDAAMPVSLPNLLNSHRTASCHHFRKTLVHTVRLVRVLIPRGRKTLHVQIGEVLRT